MKEIPQIAWNVVAKHFKPDSILEEKIRKKISKLERHLIHFPPDTIHLQIAFERFARTDTFVCELSLKLPATILHSSEKNTDPIAAFDKSIKVLIRELERLKSDLRKSKGRKRFQLLIEKTGVKPPVFAPEPVPKEEAPEDLSDILADFIKDNFERLYEYTQREIEKEELDGEIPKDSVDVGAVLDEVARIALSDPKDKPKEMDYLPWLYYLIKQEIEKRRRLLRRQAKSSIYITDEEDVVEEGKNRRPSLISLLNELPEQTNTKPGWLVLQDYSPPPDEEIARKEFIQTLLKHSKEWSPVEHDVFSLYFIEGFDADETAMILGMKINEVEKIIENLQSKIRDIIIQEASL